MDTTDVRKLSVVRLNEDPRHRCKQHIKTDLQRRMVGGSGLDTPGSCENATEPLCSIKYRECLDLLDHRSVSKQPQQRTEGAPKFRTLRCQVKKNKTYTLRTVC